MKIMMLSQTIPFPIYSNGLTLRVYHLLKQFSRHAECYLLAFADRSLKAEEKEILAQMAKYDIVHVKASANKIGTFKNLLKKFVSCRRFFSREFEVNLERSIRQFKPDIVLAEQAFMSQYVDTIQHIPKVISAVDAISLAALRISKSQNNPLMKILWRYIAWQRHKVEKFFNKFDAITVVAEEDAKYLELRLGVNIHVIPNGVDTNYFKPLSRDFPSNKLIFSGNLSSRPNEEACIYLLREVFPLLRSKYEWIEFSIIGRNPTPKIFKYAPSWVNVTGEVFDMREAMSDALIFLSPILYGTGIKNNVLQAMAMGIPVVVTPLIAKPIGIKDGVTGVIAERGNAFIEAIEILLRNDVLRHQIAENGRHHICTFFSWERVASLYIDLFNDVLERRESGIL